MSAIIAGRSGPGPSPWPIPMQPSPSAETSRPRPSVRVSMTARLASGTVPVARLLVTARLSDPAAVGRLREAGHDVVVRDDPRPAGPDELRRLAAGCAGLL